MRPQPQLPGEPKHVRNHSGVTEFPSSGGGGGCCLGGPNNKRSLPTGKLKGLLAGEKIVLEKWLWSPRFFGQAP